MRLLDLSADLSSSTVKPVLSEAHSPFSILFDCDMIPNVLTSMVEELSLTLNVSLDCIDLITLLSATVATAKWYPLALIESP